MEILKTFRQYAIEVLSAKDGPDLEISANLTSSDQFDLIIESYAHETLGAEFVEKEKDTYLRMTKSYNSKYGDYVSSIAQTPEFKGGDLIGPGNSSV